MSTTPSSPEPPFENPETPSGNPLPESERRESGVCRLPDAAFSLPEGSSVPAAPAPDQYFGVSPDNLLELPGADSFRAALEKLRLPEIAQGKPYECVVRLFTLNNRFAERIRLDAVDCIDRSDFAAELNAEKTLLHLKGTPSDDGEISIRFCYAPLPKASKIFPRTTQNEFVKSIRIQPDPVSKWSKEFKEGLRAKRFTDMPKDGQVGKPYQEDLNFQPEVVALRGRVTFTAVELLPDCGISATVTPGGEVTISGTPQQEGDLTLNLFYEYLLGDQTIRDTASIFPFAHIAPDEAYESEKSFVQGCRAIVARRAMAGAETTVEFGLEPFADPRFIEIAEVKIADFAAEYDPETRSVKAHGTPGSPGTVEAFMRYLVKTSVGDVEREISFPVLTVIPDPKTLWKNLPTDPAAPYQAADVDFKFVEAGERVIVAASKRGRSHAHEGKFRDDSFRVEYLPETGWSIVVVSDGAGSAKFSREGSKITCETFCETLKAKLSLPEINAKLDAMPAEEREKVLRNTVLSAAYQCLSKIDAESRAQNHLRKDYNATCLGYILKRFGGEWLIVSMGIGDGIIGLLGRDDRLLLLSEPDGGEFVGQTRFITMNEVWNNDPIRRVRVSKIADFAVIMSMSDGVSDPKFETDNNLQNERLWLDLWNDIASQVPLAERSAATAQKLCDWLDFWSKGNHDDRTIVLMY